MFPRTKSSFPKKAKLFYGSVFWSESRHCIIVDHKYEDNPAYDRMTRHIQADDSQFYSNTSPRLALHIAIDMLTTYFPGLLKYCGILGH